MVREEGRMNQNSYNSFREAIEEPEESVIRLYEGGREQGLETIGQRKREEPRREERKREQGGRQERRTEERKI